MHRPSLLLVTDLAYRAQGRRYGDEDVWLSGRLREEFDVALCSPLDAAALLERFDVVLVRNSGPVLHYRDAYEAFRSRARATGARLVNPLTGQGDMAGKQYLVDLSATGEPVIPSIGRCDDLHLLPAADRYVVKPLHGADSIGLQVLDRAALERADLTGALAQPLVDLREEVSFVFVGRRFSYALRTTSPDRRWELEPFDPSPADLAFAQRFVDRNALDVGVQRVDAGRTFTGELLLVELEDLNPYLSLDLLPPAVREAFCAALVASLRRALALPRPGRG